MTTRKQKRNQRGGQPLSYTNPRYAEPSALPGGPLLNSGGTGTGAIARPEIGQKGGTQRFYTETGQWVPWTQTGAPLVIQRQTGGQPLSYTNPRYAEPSALLGGPLLESYKTVARPELGQKGGFSPSIMTNLVGNAAYLTPLAMTAAYRLWSNKETRKQRKQHGGNGEEWETYKQQAKGMLQGIAPGKANGKWINKLAKILKEKKNTAVVLDEFAQTKGVEVLNKERPRFATKLNEWEYDQRQAKKELSKYGEPTAVEVTHLAALRTGRKGKEGDADLFIGQFQKQHLAKKNAYFAAEREKEEKRIQKQIREAAKLTHIPKVKAVKPEKPVKAEKPKISINERPWDQIRLEAKDELYALKKTMKRGNVMKYASMKRFKNLERQQAFLDEFRKRPNVLKKNASRESTPEATTESNEEFHRNREPRKRKTMKKGREEWESYQSGARRMLERIGDATIAEISGLAKMMKQGENIRPFLNDFEQRVKRTEVRERELEERKATPPKAVNVVDGLETKEEPVKESVPAPVAVPVAAPVPAPVAVPVKETVAKPIAQQGPAKPLRPIDLQKFADFRQRMDELAKKYPGPK
jgi:hypothetical protein